ncbi:hypothetical protein RHMOL_Rhmol12G0158400 [Rhododendron molle]|uniref:Uncharacterized protein n=1 Tax=Rhododendron molle TaxID=49168 RepID=A0ACC0LIH9_RHOML|nr:hypothetical protein RHMOL_Rhmol12G0158400 [Rhododendron molle]
MALWNPSTREFRPLPMSPITPPYFYTEHTFGFGLDPLTGNYKVIWIRFMVDDRTGNPLPYFVVAVYTLGSDNWRYLDPLTHTTCSLHNSLSATCINGAYYWLVSYDHAKHSILAFDMRCEDFKHIEGPDHPEGKQGSLALCIDYIALFLCQTGVLFQSSIDIWVMKEEGCWDKLVTVEPSVEVSRPLGFWNDEEVFLESSSSELFLYKHDTHEIRNLGIYGDNKAVFCYKESLLSVKGQNEDPQRCHFSDILGEDLKYIVPANKRKFMVDKTEELAKLVESFRREQEFYDRRDRLGDEFEDVHGLPEADLAKGWQMIFNDPEKLETFFTLDAGSEKPICREACSRRLNIHGILFSGCSVRGFLGSLGPLLFCSLELHTF